MVTGAAKKEGEKGVVFLKGNFDFRCSREFKSLCDPLLKDDEVMSIEINMGGVDYMDNTALGMLLTLHEKAKVVRKKVLLGECRGRARQMLDLANFEKLFEMI